MKMRLHILALLLILQGCDLFAPVDPLPPTVTTEAPTAVVPTGFVAHGTIAAPSFKNTRQEKKSGGIVEYGFILTNGSSLDTVKKGSSLSGSPLIFEHNYGGLATNKKYKVQAYAKNEGGGLSAGTAVDVTTGSYTLPTLTTGGATAINTNSASVSINISGLGNAPASESGVCYSSSVVPPTTSQSTAIISKSSATGNFNANLTGLANSTKYYARGYVITGGGVAYGNTVEFTTGTPGPTTGVFSLKINSLAKAAYLDNPGLNNNPAAITILTFSATGAMSPEPLALRYQSNKWAVVNQNPSALPANSEYNIYYTAPSDRAFRHTVATGNFAGNSTTLDHPMLNNKPDAKMMITKVMPIGVSGNSSPVGVYYSGGRWRIFNQRTTTPMTVGTEFNVIIDNRIFETTVPAISKNSGFSVYPAARGSFKILVTHYWKGVYNPSELGVSSFTITGRGTVWTIENQDKSTIPANSSYFVLPL